MGGDFIWFTISNSPANTARRKLSIGFANSLSNAFAPILDKPSAAPLPVVSTRRATGQAGRLRRRLVRARERFRRGVAFLRLKLGENLAFRGIIAWNIDQH